MLMLPIPRRVIGLAAAACLTASPLRAFWWGTNSDSHRPKQPITVDGRADEWDVSAMDEEDGFAFAFANDEKNLYVFFAPHTRSTKTQLAGTRAQDLSVWLDPKAGKNKTLGIRLHAPVKFSAQRELETVGIDTTTLEVQAAVGPTDDRGVFEARFPLSALGTPLPKKITVGLETSEPTGGAAERPRRSARSNSSSDADSSSPAPEASPRHGRGRGGGGGGRHGPPSAQAESSTTSLWIRVTMAK